MSKETSEEKVKVLEVEGMEFEGEYVLVPTKIQISGQTYEAEFLDDFPLAEVRYVELEKIQDVRLKEIPHCIDIYCDAPQLLGQLKISKRHASIEIWAKPKYYRGYIPIDRYFDAIKKIADKRGFETFNENRDENGYSIELTKDFSADATVAEVYKSFEEFTVKVNDIEHLAKEFIESVVLKSF